MGMDCRRKEVRGRRKAGLLLAVVRQLQARATWTPPLPHLRPARPFLPTFFPFALPVPTPAPFLPPSPPPASSARTSADSGDRDGGGRTKFYLLRPQGRPRERASRRGREGAAARVLVCMRGSVVLCSTGLCGAPAQGEIAPCRIGHGQLGLSRASAMSIYIYIFSAMATSPRAHAVAAR